MLCSVIDDDQTGYIKGRFIGQNIRLVSDIIENNKYKNGILLFFRFQESLPTVEWDSMFESLKLFNFGPMFCQWIKTMYTNPVFFLKIMVIYRQRLPWRGVLDKGRRIIVNIHAVMEKATTKLI